MNPPCLFQFTTLRNLKTISPTHYSVNIIDNSFVHKQEMCLSPFYHFTPLCRCIPNVTFHEYSPKVIYQEIIKTSNPNFAYHKICHCRQKGIINCSLDTLGPVHPGQTLQVELCTPCSNE